jgi:CBS-domain-containing membrane protein
MEHIYLNNTAQEALMQKKKRFIIYQPRYKMSKTNSKQTPWSESASELYQPSDRHLSAKWLPTFADKGCHVVSVTDPYGRILGFLDRSRYFSVK